MIVLEGLPALSAFRRDRLQTRLQQIAPDAVIAGAWHVYFVQAAPGAAPDAAVLGRIAEPREVTRVVAVQPQIDDAAAALRQLAAEDEALHARTVRAA